MTFVETLTIELKRQLTPSLTKEIVAFANTEGGTVYIGVEDDGNVIGVPEAAAVEEAVNNMIHDAIEPDLTMFAEAHVERFEDVDIVVVHVHSGPDKPYCIAGKGLRPEGVFVRRGTSAQPLAFDGIRRMLRETGGGSFEDERSLEQGLTFREAQAVFDRNAMAFGDAQKRTLGLTAPDGFYTNLGYLASDQCELGIKLARFQGRRKERLQTRREFSGSVLAQALDALDALDMLNNLTGEFDGSPARRDQRDYPPEALREALYNAMVHRDYSVPAAIHVNMYDDRCEVLSPGGLPQGAHWTGALAGVSVPRNVKLAALFYRLQWIEAYGLGMYKIFGSYEGTGLVPEVEFLEGAVKVVLPNLNAAGEAGLVGEWLDPLEAVRRKAAEAQGEGGWERAAERRAGAEGPSKVGEAPTTSVEEKRVLASLSTTEGRPKSQIVAKTGLSPAKAARILAKLVDVGLATAEGRTRGRLYRAAMG